MSSKIERIYIAAHKGDLRFTKICVASVRYWYPNIPITLIKDNYSGFFSTKEIEKNFKVDLFDTEIQSFGWGFSKLEPLFLEQREKFLVLDSDIVFAGKVLDILETYEENFIVSSHGASEKFLESHYYSPNQLKKIDPDFIPPGYAFNTGQIVITSGIFKREDFSHFIEWSEPRNVIYSDVFKMGEQGLLNYILQKKHSQGKIALKQAQFMEWGKSQDVQNIDLKNFNSESRGYPFIIHWAGLKQPLYSQIANGFILSFFEDYYYSKILFGRFKQVNEKFFRRGFFHFKRILRKILPENIKFFIKSYFSK